MFSPSLTKVPSTSLGCDLAVKQVAYASGYLIRPLFEYSSMSLDTARHVPSFSDRPGLRMLGREAVRIIYVRVFSRLQIGYIER